MIQSCISVQGKTMLIAYGEKPLSPSTQAISISSTPRFFNSVRTIYHKLAPSASLSHNPKISF
ncbi:MAG: hypothetical protein ACUVQP_12135 [Bacteroidales bacterium]